MLHGRYLCPSSTSAHTRLELPVLHVLIIHCTHKEPSAIKRRLELSHEHFIPKSLSIRLRPCDYAQFFDIVQVPRPTLLARCESYSMLGQAVKTATLSRVFVSENVQLLGLKRVHFALIIV